jgi:hypothetical protein
MDMSLLDSTFEIGIAQLPVDSRFIIADTRGKGSVSGRRNCAAARCRGFLISG